MAERAWRQRHEAATHVVSVVRPLGEEHTALPLLISPFMQLKMNLLLRSVRLASQLPKIHSKDKQRSKIERSGHPGEAAN